MERVIRKLPVVLTILLAWHAGSTATGENRPNVVLIMADDLGYGDLSCYGSDKVRTPILDRLAAGGTRLTSFYAGATVCTPSRMALLTGTYPSRLGWGGGVLGYRMKTTTGLAPKARTVAEVFRDAGYRTALCGKWHLGSTEELGPLSQGFETAFFIKMSNNQTKKLWRDDHLVADPFDNRRLTERFAQAAIEFIEKCAGRPFFLYLPFTAPHFPAEAHPDWQGRSRNGAYGDVVEELDARIGEILGALRERELEKQTIVMFLSDNGPEPGQKKFASAGPHRGLKWSSLEGGTRVPCIISWPGVVPAGRVSDDLTSAIDLLPTLARACGIGREAAADHPPLDGLDVWNSIVGDETTHPRRDLLFWSGWAIPQAIRVDSWKLYFDEVKDVRGSEAGPVLFDLAADPSEEDDLSADHPDRVAAMMERARKQLADIETHSIGLGGPPSDAKPPSEPRWLR